MTESSTITLKAFVHPTEQPILQDTGRTFCVKVGGGCGEIEDYLGDCILESCCVAPGHPLERQTLGTQVHFEGYRYQFVTHPLEGPDPAGFLTFSQGQLNGLVTAAYAKLSPTEMDVAVDGPQKQQRILRSQMRLEVVAQQPFFTEGPVLRWTVWTSSEDYTLRIPPGPEERQFKLKLDSDCAEIKAYIVACLSASCAAPRQRTEMPIEGDNTVFCPIPFGGIRYALGVCTYTSDAEGNLLLEQSALNNLIRSAYERLNPADPVIPRRKYVASMLEVTIQPYPYAGQIANSPRACVNVCMWTVE